jgi:photosystem II stability/assembly factor-like uncharacterized protein
MKNIFRKLIISTFVLSLLFSFSSAFAAYDDYIYTYGPIPLTVYDPTASITSITSVVFGGSANGSHIKRGVEYCTTGMSSTPCDLTTAERIEETGEYTQGRFNFTANNLAPNSHLHYRLYVEDEVRRTYSETKTTFLTEQKWEELSGSGKGSWTSATLSADGTKFLGVRDGYIYISNSGETWKKSENLAKQTVYGWNSIASSADGQILALATEKYIHISYDGGNSWATPIEALDEEEWCSLTLSSNNKIAAATCAGKVYIFENEDGSWIISAALDRIENERRIYQNILFSEDGTKLVGISGDYIYIYDSIVDSWSTSTEVLGKKDWYSITSSADGTKLVVAAYDDYIYTSSDSGETWATSTDAGSGYWTSVTSSADGTKLAAVSNNYIYTSKDSGETWTQTEVKDKDGYSVGGWKSITSSANGETLIAIPHYGYVYKSFDSGQTWIEESGFPEIPHMFIEVSFDGKNIITGSCGGSSGVITSSDYGLTWIRHTNMGSSKCWYSAAYSSDGSKIFLGETGGYLYISHDSGNSWATSTESLGAGHWADIASSANGDKIAAIMNDHIQISQDGGETWATSTDPGSGYWTSITSSTDGSKLAATASDGYIYTSDDGGETWATSTDAGSRNWTSITSSTDGSKLAATASDGYIYTSDDGGETWTEQIESSQKSWKKVIISGDGSRLVAMEGNGIYTSSDFGKSWNKGIGKIGGTNDWKYISTSQDGSYLFATQSYGFVYKYHNSIPEIHNIKIKK